MFGGFYYEQGRMRRTNCAHDSGSVGKKTIQKDWITINGTHVQVGEDGQLQGKVGEKISSGSANHATYSSRDLSASIKAKGKDFNERKKAVEQKLDSYQIGTKIQTVSRQGRISINTWYTKTDTNKWSINRDNKTNSKGHDSSTVAFNLVSDLTDSRKSVRLL